MRLLYFAQAFLPVVGGAERFLDQLARRMVERGHEVTVLAARVRNADNHVDAPYRLLRYRKPFSKRIFPRHTVFHLLRAHRIARPDCVHAHGAYPPGYSAALYCRWMDLPWIVRPIGGDVLPGEPVRNNPNLEAHVVHTLRSADRVVAQSVELAAIVAELGVPPARIERIPNAVDATAFARRLEPRSSDPLVAAMGVFFNKKGFDVLIDGFARVREKCPRARLSIAGDGIEKTELAEQIRACGLSDCIELPGLVEGEAKVRFLQRAWVFVSSARREPFSNANLEALACGLPMVVTAVGGNLEIVSEGENGLRVPPEDPEALAQAILALLEDAELRERMGVLSREKAREYSWGNVADRYEAVYRSIARGQN